MTTENSGIYWFCYICRKTTRGVFQTLGNLEVRLQAIESVKANDQSKLKDACNKIESLQKTCQVLETRIQQLVVNNDKTLNNVSNLRRNLFNEHKRNVILQSRMDQLEQTQRECNVSVMGYPELGESDTAIKHQLVQLIGATQGSEKNIGSITRMGKARDGKSRDLVVKFDSKENRNAFCALRKRTPKNNENKKVYINEDLIESKAKLFYHTRRLVKTLSI